KKLRTSRCFPVCPRKRTSAPHHGMSHECRGHNVTKEAPVLIVLSVRYDFFAKVARLKGVWSAELTFVVNESCIRCKTMDCVAVCPVDCFYEGENMLVIHPDECIDCGVCEPECPVDAIKADTEPGLEKWLAL